MGKAHEGLASFGFWTVGSCRQSGILANQHPFRTLLSLVGTVYLGLIGMRGFVKHKSVHKSLPTGAYGNLTSYTGVWWLQTNWQDKNLSSPWINCHKSLTQRGDHTLCRHRVNRHGTPSYCPTHMGGSHLLWTTATPAWGQQWGVLAGAGLWSLSTLG